MSPGPRGGLASGFGSACVAYYRAAVDGDVTPKARDGSTRATAVVRAELAHGVSRQQSMINAGGRELILSPARRDPARAPPAPAQRSRPRRRGPSARPRLLDRAIVPREPVRRPDELAAGAILRCVIGAFDMGVDGADSFAWQVAFMGRVDRRAEDGVGTLMNTRCSTLFGLPVCGEVAPTTGGNTLRSQSRTGHVDRHRREKSTH
jgi:hypothetical protein